MLLIDSIPIPIPNKQTFSKSTNHMDLPPGFRFHPTDEELITYYLTPKVLDTRFSAAPAIAEVDLNSVEPWDLPWKAKMGEKEWYFFCVRDRKYPTGMRTNRATGAGYWKATGKDKEIFNKAKTLVGMKKTLVFYKGRAPRGEKTGWVMHEYYRLEAMHNLPKSAKNEWVICRVFKKSSGGNRVPISGLIRGENGGKMPPLMDISSESSSHVPCFSNSVGEDQKPRNSESSGTLSNHRIMPELDVDSGMMMMQDHSILKLLLGNNQDSEVGGLRPCDDDDDNQHFIITSAPGAVDLDCLWNYHY